MDSAITIERMAYGSAGIGKLPSGKTVFVDGALPGDTVSAEIVFEKDSYARARVQEVLEPSSDRVAIFSQPDWACGTAPWQHISYDAQLRFKRENVCGALVHTAHFEVERAEQVVAACVPSPAQWGYRNKIELAASTTQGPLELGFYREGTQEFFAASQTALAHEAVQRAPKALQGALRYLQGTADLGIHRVGVRQSDITGDCEIALWTGSNGFPRKVAAKTLQQALPAATSIVRIIASAGKARKVKGTEVLYGRGFWRERIGDVAFSVAAPSFFQVNTAQAGQLVAQVLASLGDIAGSQVADLYAGGGTFSIPLAKAGAQVVAVESAGSSVRDLRFNARANGVEVNVIGGDAARELGKLGALDALVVDPPRAGLAAQAIDGIVDAAPEQLVYVSCDPATCARDIARLEERGYILQRATPVDMFPQTYHIETVCVLHCDM